MATRSTAIATALRAPDFAATLIALLAKGARKLVAAIKIVHESFLEARVMAYEAQRRHKFIAE